MNNKSSSITSNSGTSKAMREPMSGADDGRSNENALHNVELETRGEFLEDHQRDRNSKGVADGYDDSIEHRKGQDEGRDYLGIARGN